MNFENKIKIRIYSMFFLIVIGAIAACIGITKAIVGNESYSMGFLTGTGTGLIVICLIIVIKNLILLKDKEKLKARKIEEEDERNLLLAYKSAYYTFITVLLGLYGISFYLAFVNEIVLKVVSYIVEISIFVYFIIYIYLKKKM